jgi:hypothetical protein
MTSTTPDTASGDASGDGTAPAGPPAASPPAAGRRPTATPRAGFLAAAGPRLAAVLLGAASVAWAATPVPHSGLGETALVVSIVAVTAGALRLAVADIPQPEDDFMLPDYMRAWLVVLALLRTIAWEETAVVAILWLEVQHPVRAWHTAVLGFGLVAYLIVTHIAESGADPAPVLRRQWKLLAVGVCLLALGAGIALVPATAPGGGAALLRLLAAIAVVAAAVLVLPG